jgi:hypothetical protein
MAIVAATASNRVSDHATPETTIMNILTAATLAITGMRAIITRINAAVGNRTRAALNMPASGSIPVVAAAVPRQAMRGAGISRLSSPVPAEYLPALARSRILRLRLRATGSAAAHRVGRSGAAAHR